MNYSYKINGEKFTSLKQKITGKDILDLACLTPIEDYELLLKTNHKGYEPIQLTETVDLSDPGIEYLTAKLYKSIKIFIDDKEYLVEECSSTPQKLLELAGYNNDSYYLTQIKKGNTEIGYKEKNDANHKISLQNESRFCLYEREQQCVIVNAESHAWNKKTISFEEIVKLAFGDGCNPSFTYTVTYTRGVSQKPSGTLVKGNDVIVKSKMVFDAQQTNKS
ncbi:multiubiquitin domain-containing protein [Polaribacter sp. 20A6]|uniref:multiubiquitin domain-containing protein n=1 Tax=Polaribacter sp. 20A6 TaxID=2687289 RepID=UPI0013FD576F|nr:multiubiquitin domain-containing protein [Polaribacter sp. 20A6]